LAVSGPETNKVIYKLSTLCYVCEYVCERVCVCIYWWCAVAVSAPLLISSLPVRGRERRGGLRGGTVSACGLRGTKLLLQNFYAELEFLPEFLARCRTICRNLRFVPVSIIFFRRKAFFHTKPDRAMARTGADQRHLRTVTPLEIGQAARSNLHVPVQPIC